MRRFLAALSAVGVLAAAPGAAQSIAKQPQPGFNLFTVNQDIEIGKQSAVEAEKQLRLLNDRNTDRYLNRIVTRLAGSAPGAKYPYQIKAVNASEVNAFALPGGPMYVYRGLLETARSEAELAGVLAHEMSHVALRHGTHQASKAYLGQAGLGILGGLLGKSSTSKVLNAVGGTGLNVLFLKFSRDAEYQADLVGAQMMAAAGYDPLAMASLFELLRAEQGRNPSKVEQFLSSHPSSADREARIRQQAATLGKGRTSVLGGFDGMRTGLRRLPAAGPQQTVAQSNTSPDRDPLPSGDVVLRVDPPSSRYLRFEHPADYFTIDYPDNWTAYPSGLAVSLAPEGAVVTRGDGRQEMLYGVIVNHYAPFASAEDRWRGSQQRNYLPFEDRTTRPRAALEDATDDLVSTILSSNSYLSAEAGPARAERIDEAPGFSVLLSGRSPVTGEEERVVVYTRGLPDGHVVYALFTVPARDYEAMQRTFARMLRTLVVNDAAAHRITAKNGAPRR